MKQQQTTCKTKIPATWKIMKPDAAQAVTPHLSVEDSQVSPLGHNASSSLLPES